MPVIDGEKWACSSCIKGHRVSGCIHNDRELHHINPKGRPVKQCEHCRGARKSKSHHARCDCGDKKDKDKLKEKGDASPSHASSAHDGRCQCHSGAKCICGTAKESDDLVLDTTRQTLHDARTKPKLTTTQSEGHLTIFANGHHKPCHRNNNSAHISGAPYKIPRPHTLHGHAAFASLSQGCNSYISKPEVPTTRSMDTLSLSNNQFYAMFGSTQRAVEDSPVTTMASSLDATAFQDSLFTSQSSLFSQDGNSPGSNVSEPFSSQQWPWAANTAVTPINSMFNYGSLSTSPSQDCLPNLESDWSIPSSGFNPLWSAGDLPLDPGKFTDALAQPISHSGESKLSGPGLTAASSVHSEIGEQNLFGDLDINKSTNPSASESLFWEDSPVYRLSAPGSNESISAPVSLGATSVPHMQGLESDFTKGLGAASMSMPNTTANDFPETAAIAMPSSLQDEISIDPWPIEQSTGPFGGLSGFDLNYSNNWF
ncbi:hypothetical protein GQ44DRAFT_606025 [Phaeosphaeriaceae sp. PMI808]|nr:hypothetical protein GQ44DRAFT_606025 [Phaeosphaeriaceae sp. PMI808]